MRLNEFLSQLGSQFNNDGKIDQDQISELRRHRDTALREFIAEATLLESVSTNWQPDVYTATHTEKLLHFGIRHPSTNVELPRCMQGEQCVCRDINNTFAFGALCIFMSPSEWKVWLDTGAVPHEERMCVLCSRFNADTYWRIAERTQGATGPCTPDFVNLCDTPDGYKSQYMLGPASGMHTLTGAIVKHVPQLLQIVRGPHGNMYVDESKIRFGAPKMQLN